MRKFIALCLGALLALAPVPAVAGITQIAGTGGGGAITNITFAAGASVGLVTTAAIGSGSLVIAIMQNTGSTVSGGFTCSDTHSNTYTSGQSVTTISGGASVQILYSYLTTGISNGDTITCTQTSGPNGITGEILAFSGTSSAPYDSASATGVTNAGTTGSISVGPTGTLTCPGGGAGCEVLIGADTWTNSGTITADSNFTSTGASSFWSTGFWIVSASTARSFTNSTNATSGAFAGQLQGFKAASGVAPVCRRSLLGVGC